jgi:hypothetical protein
LGINIAWFEDLFAEDLVVELLVIVEDLLDCVVE